MAGCSSNKDSPICKTVRVPQAEIFAIDVSFRGLKDKAERFREDAEIQEALTGAMVDRLALPTLPEDPETRFATLRAETFDVDALAGRGYGHERLDQLVTELLLGVR